MLQRIVQSPQKRMFGFGLATGGVIASIAAIAMVPASEAPKVHLVPFSIPAPFFFPYTPEPEPVPPRATSPQLRGACIDDVGDNETVCEWDDGFPAISRDGTTIVVKRVDADPGARAVTILFIDVATSRVKSQAQIRNIETISIYDDEEQDNQKMRVAKQATAIQKQIDAIGFRSLTKPATWDVQQERAHVRVVETKTNETVFQTEYLPPAALPDVSYGADVRWDAETKVLLSEVYFCESPSEGARCVPHYFARRL